MPSEEMMTNNILLQNTTITKTARILLNVEDYHQAAKEKLSKMVYDYYRTGADDEVTLHENNAAYRRIKLRPSMFVDVSHHNTDPNSCAVSLLNGQTKCSFPVLIAPTAYHRLAEDGGERSTARAAVLANTVMIVATLATTSLEDVAHEHRQALIENPNSTSQLWFQMYIFKDREFTTRLVRRAEQAGYRALVLTVDLCRPGNREADHRNHFRLPEHMERPNFADAIRKEGHNEQVEIFRIFLGRIFDASLTWSDIGWLRQITQLPIIVKGIMTSEDARRAVKAGVNGIIVSNHGGRQLDTISSTIEVLPEIVSAVRGQNANKTVDIYIDGGIRRGTDILKAVALGAKAVLVGRPILWGLAVGGTQGVVDVLEVLRREFKLAMMLCGCATLPNTASILSLPMSKL